MKWYRFSKPLAVRVLALGFLLFVAGAPAGRGDFVSGQPADLALGDMPMAGKLSSPAGIAVDAGSQKVFVADPVLHRVLRFSSMAALTNGGQAEAVLGQPDFNQASPGTGAARLASPVGLCADGGRLWVADTGNNRVLRFDNAAMLATGAAAAAVLGQPDFSTTGSGATASRLSAPRDLVIDPSGRLWVADSGNHRVLRFDGAASLANGAAAAAVLGQTAFGAASPGAGTSRFDTPSGLAIDSSGGQTTRLWVADSGNHRVLAFTNPAAKPLGASADAVLGRISLADTTAPVLAANRLYSPMGLKSSGGNLWVCDTIHNRVLLFSAAGSKPNGGSADHVLGKANFTDFSLTDPAGNLFQPQALAVDGTRLWITDTRKARVVRHEQAAAKANGAPADGVLGQSDFVPRKLRQPKGAVIDPASGKLFVAEPELNRVLRFASVRTLTTGSEPEAVFGQPNFTNTTPGTTATRMSGPSGLAVDWFGNLWVADTGNNRVLRIPSAATATNGAAATLVLGQKNFATLSAATAPDGLSRPSALAIEMGFTPNFQLVLRRLWVADPGNNRVIRFENPLSLAHGAAATGVLGAPSLNVAGTGLYTASSMSSPTGLAVELNGRLWVSDNDLGRVLRFDAAAQKPNGDVADGVLLRTSFTEDVRRNWAPEGISIGTDGRLFVAQGDRQIVAWWNNAASQPDGADPHGAFGVPGTHHPGTPYTHLSSPAAATIDPLSGRVWVSDSFNNRLLRFTPSLDTRITQAGFNDQGRFTLTLTGRPGEMFDIRSSLDLKGWDTLERTETMSSTGTMIWSAPTTPTGPQQFYRLQVP
jgi:DNA-binding beta-propeller fold protein YncE